MDQCQVVWDVRARGLAAATSEAGAAPPGGVDGSDDGHPLPLGSLPGEAGMEAEEACDHGKKKEAARLHRQMILGVDYGGSSLGADVAADEPGDVLPIERWPPESEPYNSVVIKYFRRHEDLKNKK